MYVYESHETRSASAFRRQTHNLPRPPELHTSYQRPVAPASPEDNDQARKTAEHGEQWGGGVDAVDPGDPARSVGATNRLNTRRNSQGKWSN